MRTLGFIVFAFCFLGIVFLNNSPHAQNLDMAKAECAELGFTPGTEKFGECVLKLMDSDLEEAPAAAPKKATPAPVTRVVTYRVEVEGGFESLPPGYELRDGDLPGYESKANSGCGRDYIFRVKNESRGIHYGYISLFHATGSNCRVGDYTRKKKRTLERWTGETFSDSDLEEFFLNNNNGTATVVSYTTSGGTPCAAGLTLPRQTRVVLIDLCGNHANVSKDVVEFLNGMKF